MSKNNQPPAAQGQAIKWHSVKDKMPEDNQSCWIAGPNANFILGPIVFKSPHGWVDLFATAEAGSLFTVETGITHWTEEESINEPEYE